jgi:acyl-coenzyme A synthetase/AMP-(fatty) acid ligase
VVDSIPLTLAHQSSVGKTLPPFECLILDEDGSQLAAGERSQIYFRDTSGRRITYHNDPAKTLAAYLKHGVFTLGEVGH